MLEKSSCGVGFVSNLKGIKSCQILKLGIEAVKNLTHRGAVGADGKTGDGCGVLFEIPEQFFASYLESMGLPEKDYKHIAVATVFSYQDLELNRLATIFESFGFDRVFRRDVPVNLSALGEVSRKSMPDIYQLVIPHNFDKDEAEKRLFIIGRLIEKSFDKLYLVSISTYNIVYKGMLIAPYLDMFYPDLKNPDFETSYCIFHQRYSTNTSPKWELAQPFSSIAHNGEINTIKGNRMKFMSLEEMLTIKDFPEIYKRIKPLLSFNESDSLSLDKVFKLMITNGYNPLLAINILIPPAWENLPFIDYKLKGMFQYNELLCEPWDGPAAIVFTDGKEIGAHLDRNGLRPLRYNLYEDGVIVVGSETGMINLDSKIIRYGKLNSGDTISLRLDKGVLRTRMEIFNELAIVKDFERKICVGFKKLNETNEFCENMDEDLLNKLKTAFAYTWEEIEEIIPFAAEKGMEFIYSMGDDTPVPPLCKNPQLIYRFFKQKFAQVTNPPIDPIREKGVMSLTVYLGERESILDYDSPKHCEKLALPSPVLSKSEFEQILRHFDEKSVVISTLFKDGKDFKKALSDFSENLKAHLLKGATLIVLSDRGLRDGFYYIPALLATSVAIRVARELNLSSKINIILESGEVRDSHQISCLLGYGASLIYPYLAYELVNNLGLKPYLFRIALNYGILKIISKMGISCVSSYIGSQLFDALFLDKEFVENYFPQTDYSLSGVDIYKLFENHRYYVDRAFKEHKDPSPGGDLRSKKDGEWHGWSQQLVVSLHKFLKTADKKYYEEYVNAANNMHPTFIRDLLDIKKDKPIPIDEVEKKEEILKRFSTAAMSIGALSPEAHSTINESARLVNMKCNSGEGGEDEKKYWTGMGSSIRQVASGRFGVTLEYLASAEEIEIKIAQGAKPGEGGQLPGNKVNAYISKLRHSQKGVTLISPPPHHDIYSIEDLAQLINDLKNINPSARIGVKLVSEKGIGQIACGVAKAHADYIQISAVDGGTGASPYVSIKNAGSYLELGLCETHLSLIENGLRDRVTLRVDGGIKTGKDIVILALLGAEEFAFGTLCMLAVGCVMDRKCHLNSCSVGVATQDEALRKRFRGSKEGFTLLFNTIAEDVRGWLSKAGAKSLANIVGKGYFLKRREWEDVEAVKKINIEELIAKYNEKTHVFCKVYRNEPKDNDLNDRICEDLLESIKEEKPAIRCYKIRNIDRSVPVKLNYFMADHYRGRDVEEDLIKIRFEGVAGQSFGAFNSKGLFIELIGEANDYVGKGMAGGKIVIRGRNLEESHKNYLAGNTLLYGATGGELYIAGRAGERFAVRNSGAVAVIEGAGHHLCEYMTGGIVIVLGGVGLNIGAGMTGGVIYVLDESKNLDKRLNLDYVKLENMEESDYKVLKMFITNHYFYTESQRAKYILDNWEESKSRIKKICPR